MAIVDLLPRLRGTGTHRAATTAELRDENREITRDLADSVTTAARLTVELAATRQECDAAVAEVRRLQDRVIWQAAENARLRKAVTDARPRITVVDTQLAKPHAPVVALPYVHQAVS